MNNNAVVFINVTQNIITGNRMTTFGHDVFLLQAFFGQFKNLFRIDLFFFLRFFFFRFFLVAVPEGERQVFLPVAGLLFSQLVFVRFSQSNGFAADGGQ